MKVVVILPTYNERKNLKTLIPEIFGVFHENKINGNVIVVDDSSPDGTAEIVKELMGRYPLKLIERERKLGIGSAYIAGFKRALLDNANFIFEMDADLSHSPQEIPKFLEKIEGGFDLIIGSRRVKGGKIVNWPWSRRVISFGGNLIGRYLAGVDIADLTSGYRVYRSKVLEEINLEKIKSNGYAFQLEILAKCMKKGFKIATIPITFQDRQSGKSKLSCKELFDFFIVAMRIRLGLIN